ncbi:MAG: hypothetical protein ACRYFX_19620 [Janthinobacterium lividum]
MNKLPAAIHLATLQAGRCLDKAEFYQTKSQAQYRDQAAADYQAWAERWATIEELLRELARLRNACKRSGINTDW